MTKKQVGFVGLGKIGSKMAMRLARAGFLRGVYDLRPEAMSEFTALGVRAASSPKDLAMDVDMVVIMVVNLDQTEEVLFGADGAVEGLAEGAIVACMNTIGPRGIRELAARLAERGIRTLDAPVSTGVKGAEAGTLEIMAGAEPDVKDETEDVLAAMGRDIFWVGPVGNGQTLKMMNQLLCSVELVSISEALVLGAKAGIDGQTLYEVTRAGSGNSAMFMGKVPKIIEGDFSSEGDVDIHLKDLDIVTQTARELGVPLVLTNVAKEILRAAHALGRGTLDGGGVITVLEDTVGVKVRKDGV